MQASGRCAALHGAVTAITKLRVQEIKAIKPFVLERDCSLNTTKSALTRGPEKLARAWAGYSDI